MLLFLIFVSCFLNPPRAPLFQILQMNTNVSCTERPPEPHPKARTRTPPMVQAPAHPRAVDSAPPGNHGGPHGNETSTTADDPPPSILPAASMAVHIRRRPSPPSRIDRWEWITATARWMASTLTERRRRRMGRRRRMRMRGMARRRNRRGRAGLWTIMDGSSLRLRLRLRL